MSNFSNFSNQPHRYSLENIIVVTLLQCEINVYICSKYTTI